MACGQFVELCEMDFMHGFGGGAGRKGEGSEVADIFRGPRSASKSYVILIMFRLCAVFFFWCVYGWLFSVMD